MSIAFAVFFVVDVVEDAEIGGVARGGDAVFVDGLEHGASGFVGVGAVAVAAGSAFAEDFGEVVGHFVFVVVNRAEAFDSRGVDDVAALGEGEHFGEGGGVHAGEVGLGDFGGAQVEAWNEGVDQRGFSDAGVAGEEGDFVAEGIAEFVDALARGGGGVDYAVADGGVEIGDGVEQLSLLVGLQQVNFVDDDDGVDAIGFGC